MEAPVPVAGVVGQDHTSLKSIKMVSDRIRMTIIHSRISARVPSRREITNVLHRDISKTFC